MLESSKSLNKLKRIKRALAVVDPAAFAVCYGQINPSPGQVKFLNAICSPAPEHRQIVAKVLRGGGKTRNAAIAFAWLFLNDPSWRIFVLSGAYWQARRLYQYFMPLVKNPEIFPQDWLINEPTQYLTQFRQGGSLEVLTASTKRIRGGHADILCIDEAVLVKQDLIAAVWPVVRTSKRLKRIVISTASNEVNLQWFLTIWQDAKRLGFDRHEWKIDECHWIDKTDLEFAARMLDSQTFRVEYLGEIAERKGRVWDSALIDKSLVDPSQAESYPPPAKSPSTEWSLGLDWGFIHPTVITVWEKQGETVYARDCRIRTQEALSDIMQEIHKDFHNITIYADSSGAHENDQLRRLGLNVQPVIFSKQKEELIGHARWRLEQQLIKIPNPELDQKFLTLIQQMKAYNYDENGKPRKKNDDCVDSMLCGMAPFLQPAGLFELAGARRRQ